MALKGPHQSPGLLLPICMARKINLLVCARVHRPSILLGSGDYLFVVSLKMGAIPHPQAALRSTWLLLRTRLRGNKEFRNGEGTVSWILTRWISILLAGRYIQVYTDGIN